MKTVQDIPGLKEVLSDCKRKTELLLKRNVTMKFSIKVHQVSAEQLISIVCQACNVTWSQVESGSQQTPIIIARQLICYFAAEKLGKTLDKIALVMGYSDHTGVQRAVKRVKEMIDTNDELYMSRLSPVSVKLDQLLEGSDVKAEE